MKRVIEWAILIVIGLAIVGAGIYFEMYGEKPTINRLSRLRSFPQTVEEVMPSVVHLVNHTRGVQGSGVAVTKDIIFTARHLIQDCDELTITLNSGEKVKATQAISSKEYDIGFIKLDESEWPCGEPILQPAEFASIKDCRLGTAVFVVGSPFGKIHFNSVTLGIISGLERNIDDFASREGYQNSGWHVTFTTDAAGHPGNSGCPVFTMDGKVRGILVAGFSPVLIHVVPIDTVFEDLPRIEILFTLDDYSVEVSPERYGDYHYRYLRPSNPRQPIGEPYRPPFSLRRK
jgi:S1-C subfamily serine protease